MRAVRSTSPRGVVLNPAFKASERDMLTAGVVVGLMVAGMLVVWISSVGVPTWLGQVTFGAAALLILLGAFCWERLLP